MTPQKAQCNLEPENIHDVQDDQDFSLCLLLTLMLFDALHGAKRSAGYIIKKRCKAEYNNKQNLLKDFAKKKRFDSLQNSLNERRFHDIIGIFNLICKS